MPATRRRCGRRCGRPRRAASSSAPIRALPTARISAAAADAAARGARRDRSARRCARWSSSARRRAWPVRYVKLHGALANMAAEEPAIAALCFAAVEGLVRDMAILAIDNSRAGRGRRGARLPHDPRGLCRPRLSAQRPAGAAADAGRGAARRRLRSPSARCGWREQGEIVAVDGDDRSRPTATSLCIHGDTPEAVAIARARARPSLACRGG